MAYSGVGEEEGREGGEHRNGGGEMDRCMEACVMGRRGQRLRPEVWSSCTSADDDECPKKRVQTKKRVFVIVHLWES